MQQPPVPNPHHDPEAVHWFIAATILGGMSAGIVFWLLLYHERQANEVLNIIIRKVQSWV